jgi:thiosulfate dehydrogenase
MKPQLVKRELRRNQMSRLGRVTRLGAVASIAMAAIFLAGAALAEPDQGSIARGGKLYDKWYKVIKAETPKESHKL